MHLPLQITLRNLAHSDEVDQLIRERADRLQHFHAHLVSCHVVLELAGRHQHQGKQFVVRIDLKVPGAEIAVHHQHDEDVRIAIREAFAAARRQLEDQARLRRGDVKFHRA
jgi:ribosome-associated translation inhibitor RaiA